MTARDAMAWTDWWCCPESDVVCASTLSWARTGGAATQLCLTCCQARMLVQAALLLEEDDDSHLAASSKRQKAGKVSPAPHWECDLLILQVAWEACSATPALA